MHSFHRTPLCEVYWEGFKSDTYALQSCGWSAALEHDSFRHGRTRLLLEHRKFQWAMYAECDSPYGALLAEAWPGDPDSYMRDGRPPRFRVTHCHPSERLLYFGSRPMSLDFGHVDMHPRIDGQPVSKGCIFPPWQAETREFVVAPDKVADLMERIRKLQEPELAEIRERNRNRDARERPAELHHATILSIAA